MKVADHVPVKQLPPPDVAYLTDIYFGPGSVARVPELLARLGVSRPLVVSDAELLKLGMVALLGIGDPAIFAGTETNPTETNLRDCLARYVEGGCDGIVALGGGAPLDLAKLVGLMVGHPPPLEQYAILRGGTARIGPSMPALVAVPTTAGSGSEVGRAALLKLDSGRKLGFLSPHLLPRVAVCDPDLTRSLPPGLTAATGMDAISHCVETYCSTRVNAVADAIALDGLGRGWRAIRRAQADGADREARTQMMHCSLMGGLAFQKGLGAVHSLSHPLGALAGLRLHHGTLNALFLAPVLRFNQEACAHKLAALATAMGLRDGAEVPEAFEHLVDDLGLPRRLRDLGVPKAALPALAPQAFEDHCTATNPRALDEAEARRLYEEAW
jgi:4-hydroxybutyrate dehydrogenase